MIGRPIDPEPKVESQLVYDWKLSNYVSLNVELKDECYNLIKLFGYCDAICQQR